MTLALILFGAALGCAFLAGIYAICKVGGMADQAIDADFEVVETRGVDLHV